MEEEFVRKNNPKKAFKSIENDEAGGDYWTVINLPETVLESIIPVGFYCYDDTGICPFWDLVEDADNQECGYCHLLETGDIDINSGRVLIDRETGETITGDSMGIPIGLLWDQCKECNINIDLPDDYEDE